MNDPESCGVLESLEFDEAEHDYDRRLSLHIREMILCGFIGYNFRTGQLEIRELGGES